MVRTCGGVVVVRWSILGGPRGRLVKGRSWGRQLARPAGKEGNMTGRLLPVILIEPVKLSK